MITRVFAAIFVALALSACKARIATEIFLADMSELEEGEALGVQRVP